MSRFNGNSDRNISRLLFLVLNPAGPLLGTMASLLTTTSRAQPSTLWLK